MFDIGFSELFVIAVVALLVLGPERLPKAARFAGLWMRRARAQWYSVKSELEHELATDELRRSLRQTQDELRDAHTHLQREGEALRREFTDDAQGDAGRAAPAGAGVAPSMDTSGDAGGASSAPPATQAGAAAPPPPADPPARRADER